MFEFKVFLNKQLLQRTIVNKAQVSVGRSPQNDLVLQDKHVSRLHYYRLKVVELAIPPLRKHPEDIPMLCAHFLEKFAEELHYIPDFAI